MRWPRWASHLNAVLGRVSFSATALILPVVSGVVVWGLARACARFRWARIPVLLVPIGLGALFAYGGLSAPSGYAAGYSFGGAWVAAVVTALGSVVLLPFRKTRRAGFLGLAAACILLAAFYCIFFAGYKLGLYEWWGDRLVPIPSVEPK